MKLKPHLVVLALIVASLFVLARTARAQTGVGPPNQHAPPPPAPLSQSFTVFVPTDGAANASFEVPRFDPKLGTLRSASIRVSTLHLQQYGVEQTAPGRALFYWGDGPLYDDDAACFTYLQISAPSGQTVCSDLNFWPLVVNKLAGFDGSVDFDGASGTTTTLMASSDLAPIDMDLAGLIGPAGDPGAATFAVSRSGFVFHSGTTANVTGFYQRRIGATATITYRFN